METYRIEVTTCKVEPITIRKQQHTTLIEAEDIMRARQVASRIADLEVMTHGDRVSLYQDSDLLYTVDGELHGGKFFKIGRFTTTGLGRVTADMEIESTKRVTR